MTHGTGQQVNVFFRIIGTVYVLIILQHECPGAWGQAEGQGSKRVG